MRQGSAETGLVMVALRWGPPKTLLVGGFPGCAGLPGTPLPCAVPGGLLTPALLPVMLDVTLPWRCWDTAPMACRDWVAGNQGYPCHALGRGSPPTSLPSHATATPGIPTASLWGCAVGTTWGLFGAKACQGAGCGLGARGNGGTVVQSCSMSQVETCQGCHVINTQ